MSRPRIPRVHVFDGDDPDFRSKTQVCSRCHESFIVNDPGTRAQASDLFVTMEKLDGYEPPRGYDWCEKAVRSPFMV